MNVIGFKSGERDWREKPVPTFSRPALIARCFAVIAAAAGVAACNETAGDMGLAVGQTVMAPAGAPIAVESLSGGPEAIRARFASALSQEASQRRIELVGAAGPAPKPGVRAAASAAPQPRYRIRGYLDAYPDESGKIAFAYVWDVYDTAKQRAQRVEGAAQVRGSAADPWSAIDEAALKAVAAKSMNDIAGFLVAAGPAPAGATQVAAARPKPAAARPLAYAPVDE